MKKSSHIPLGSVCYRLQDAKVLAQQWSRSIQDPLWSMATEALLIALMRKLQSEKGKKWDMPDLRLLTQLSHDELSQIIRTHQPKSAWLLNGDFKIADVLMINVQIALSGLIA